MVSIIVTSKDENQRMDKYVKKVLKNAPDSFIYKMMRKKNIVLNQKKCDGKEVLSTGDEIKIYLSDETFEKFSGKKVAEKDKALSIDNKELEQYKKAFEKIKINILYENSHALIIDKPSGVLSQKAKPEDISANEWLIGYLLNKSEVTSSSLVTFKPSVCNRLDRNTSGILVCAKTLIGAQFLSKIISSKELEKYYAALIFGNYSIHERLTGYLYKDEMTNKVTIYKNENEIPKSVKGKVDLIDTAFDTLKRFNDFTLLEVQLFTGKPHQIRAHLASIGYPIVGDHKYGNSSLNKKYYADSQLLHAKRIVFPIITEDEFKDLSKMTIDCELPSKFNKYCEE